ncbi:MAG TPA: DUF423 domain-containing protein [Chitinophagales bacterium]|nr:DUF423 domain-containing protein [Chitinophagales bacterium]
MQKGFLIAAAAAGLSAVALGAFGAHGLRNLVAPEMIVIWEKGVQYQIYHALTLFMCSLYLKKESSTYVRNAAICFILGILCFSGSLYLLATRTLTNIPAVILGPVTPIGGFFFIAGWGLILLQAVKKEETQGV